MTPTQKIIEEFDERFPQFMEYPQAFQGLEPDREKIKSFLLSSLHQVATEAIEAVRLEKKEISEVGYGNVENAFNEGFNFAILDTKQKAKKFLENL